MGARVARPREARGWFVYALAVTAAFLVLILRLVYADVEAPYLLLPFVDLALLAAVLAGVLALLGLRQALWYHLVKRIGPPLWAASFLMFAVGVMLFYALPDHLGRQDIFLSQFTAALVLFVYVPALSYGSRGFLGVGIAGAAVLLAVSLYGPLMGSASLLHPLVLGTLAAEGLLVLTLLRLMQLTMRPARATPA